jgi:hypothetical protein
MSAAELARSESSYVAGAAALDHIVAARFGIGARIVGHGFLHHEQHPVVATLTLDGASVLTAVAKFAVDDG